MKNEVKGDSKLKGCGIIFLIWFVAFPIVVVFIIPFIWHILIFILGSGTE